MKTFVSPVMTYVETEPNSEPQEQEGTAGYYYGEPSQPCEVPFSQPMDIKTSFQPNFTQSQAIETENDEIFEPETAAPECPNVFDDSSNDSERTISIYSDELLMPNPPNDLIFRNKLNISAIQPVKVPAFLASQLREHQKVGIRFLYECVMGFHSINGIPIEGAILADEMGLGKTIQTIALIYMLLKQNPFNKLVPIARRVLIVTNSSLVENWKQEIFKWLEHQRIYSFEVSAKNKPSKFANATQIPIMIISYESLAKHIDDIKNINFDVVVCDEGHKMKNVNTNVASRLNELPCKRRIILTGTPIQNNLEELHALVDFVNPGVLGNYSEFKVRYENPIVQSQNPSVLPQFKELGILRQKELSEILKKFILRRTQDVLQKFLPQKQEIVVVCAASDVQRALYTKLLTYYHEQKENLEKTVSPLQLITMLKKICNQPSLLLSDKSPEFAFLRKKIPSISQSSIYDSSKLEIVHFLLEALKETDERVVLVSNYNKTLDILEAMCRDFSFNYVRLDGTTAISDRAKAVKSLNDPSSNTFVFLLSAKAGGTGLNLIGASRLVLYDNDWNPATDSQALARIWRDGQTRKVYIYRLVTANTIEEKIFQRQMTKTSLGGCVMDHNVNQKSLKFTDEELKALFAVPEDYETCSTHEMLKCKCAGLGDVPEESSQESMEMLLDSESNDGSEASFKIRPKNRAKPKNPGVNSLQMHELMKYEHHMAPVEEDLLEELCLKDAIDIIKFIFRNVTESKVTI